MALSVKRRQAENLRSLNWDYTQKQHQMVCKLGKATLPYMEPWEIKGTLQVLHPLRVL